MSDHTSSNRICVICGGPPEAHDGKIVLHAFGHTIPNSAAKCRCLYLDAPACTYPDCTAGRSTPNRVVLDQQGIEWVKTMLMDYYGPHKDQLVVQEAAARLGDILEAIGEWE